MVPMKTKVIAPSAGSFPAARRKAISNLIRTRRPLTATGVIVAASCLCGLMPAMAAPGSWTQKMDMPAPTSAPAACVVDGILYVIGGHYPYTKQLRTVFAYDPAKGRCGNVGKPHQQGRRIKILHFRAISLTPWL